MRSTNLGRMSRTRRNKISIAIIKLLVHFSQLDRYEAHKYGLLWANTELTYEQIDWVAKRLVKPIPLSARDIKDNLPEKYKLATQQITRLVRRIPPPPDTELLVVQRRTHQEFLLIPSK